MKKEKYICRKIQLACHPGSLLTGVSLGYVRKDDKQAICIGRKSAGDPGQKLSGMTPYFKRACGFTLIELLVVILIIGILAAVALPQYNKAVTKARMTEARLMLNTIYKSYQICSLTYGPFADECMIQNANGLMSHSDIEIPGQIIQENCLSDGTGCYATANWYYGMSVGEEGCVDCTKKWITIAAESVERDPNYPNEPRYYFVTEDGQLLE